MIPISESVRVRRTPWVTTLLVLACLLMFVYELTLPPEALDRFIQEWGANPHLILMALAGDPRVSRTELLTLFTSQFLHGGWVHLLGNIVFLWVFGKAVEDRFGPFTYLVLYLIGGAGAGLVQSWASGPEGTLALIGASGAIATVLGAYLVMFPTAWVKVLVPVAFFFWAFDVPAVLMLALWFFGQFFTGVAFMSQAAAPGHVAVWAHVGGFVLGMLFGLLVPKAPTFGPRPLVVVHRPEGPGPRGLISSIADLAALVLAVRILFHLLDLRSGPDLIGQIAGFAYGITDPFVGPFEEFVPWLIVMGLPFDLPALVVMLLVYVAAGILIQVLGGGPVRRPRGDYW